MNKEELLQELSNKISTGEITHEEVASKISTTMVTPLNTIVTKEPSHFSMTKMMYVLGAAIVVVGIIIFVGQIWEDIGSLGRIVVTLGLGLLITAVGSMLLKSKPGDNIGPVFHAIGGLLIPGGAMVTLSELSTGVYKAWPIVGVFAAISIFYLLLNFIHKHVVLTLFTIANTTAFIYFLVEAMVEGSFYLHGELYAYLTMIVGASYLLLAHSFRGGWNQRLVGALHFLGTVAFLGAAFSRVFDSVPWQMIYFLIVIGGIFLSAYFKSRSILFVSTLFLIAHVSYITSKYFADSVGWPVSLIILGFIFIGLGYMSITINKKYIKQ